MRYVCVCFPLKNSTTDFFFFLLTFFLPPFLLIFRGKPGYAHVTYFLVFFRLHCIYLRQCISNVRRTCHADCDCRAVYTAYIYKCACACALVWGLGGRSTRFLPSTKKCAEKNNAAVLV